MRRQREIKVFSIILAAVLFCTLCGCTRTTVPETEKPAEPVTEASTEAPSKTPTEAPAEAPTTTEVPTEAPTEAPTEGPTEAPTKASTEAPTEPPTETPPAGDDARISLAQAILTESGTLTLLYGPEYRKGEQFNGERITDLWSGDEIIVQDVTPGWFGKGCEKYVIDESFAQVTPTNMAHWFEGCPEDGIVGLENLNTSRAEDMYNMFSYTGLKSLDLSTFDTSSVRLMDEMFRESVDLEYLDLSSFDTSNVTCMDRMFSGCVSLKTLDLSNFDCSKLESMFRMFEGAGMTTLDLSVKNLPSNLDTFGTFTYCTELEMIFCENSDTNFETEDTSTTFYCEKLKGYYGENEVPFKEFESGDRHLCSAKLGGYFTPKFMKITFDANGGTGEMEDLMALSYFYSGGGTDLPANAFAKEGVCFTGWNTEADGSGENYQDAAEIWPKEDLTLYAQWGDPEKMAQVIWTEEDKTLTFLCGPLYRPGDAFNGKTVTKTWCGMEVTATQLGGKWKEETNRTYEKMVFDKSFAQVRPTSLQLWFSGVSDGMIVGLENLNTSMVTNMMETFLSATVTTLDLSTFDTSKVTDMERMFCSCQQLKTLDLSSFNLAKVESMGEMFFQCSSLESVDLGESEALNLTRTVMMFYECSHLTSVNLSGFDSVRLSFAWRMFESCTELTTIYCKSSDAAWTFIEDPENPTGNAGMFEYTPKLVGRYGTIEVKDAGESEELAKSAKLGGYFTPKE